MAVGSSPVFPVADVREVTLDCGRGCHRRAHQVRAPAASLPAFEVAIARRGAALAFAEDVVVHAEAHRAARLAPFEAGLGKHAIEAFALRLRLDLLRSGNDQGP